MLYGSTPQGDCVGVYSAATQGFPKPKDPINLICAKMYYEKWNAKAKDTFLEAFAWMFLIEYIGIRKLMLFVRMYAYFMREQRASVGNIIIWL